MKSNSYQDLIVWQKSMDLVEYLLNEIQKMFNVMIKNLETKN